MNKDISDEDSQSVDLPKAPDITPKPELLLKEDWTNNRGPSLAKPWLLKKSPHRYRSNSTSHLYVDSTIYSPKSKELLTCIAENFHGSIQDISCATPQQRALFEIFDETRHPTSEEADIDLEAIPSFDSVLENLKGIFTVGKLEPESLIMAVAYLDRIRSNPRMPCPIFSFNWRRILLSVLILSCKVWEDDAVWNADFIDLFPAVSAHDLQLMEKKLLALLSFDVSLTSSEYAKIYFDIRAESETVRHQVSDMVPLDKDGKERLEERSRSYAGKHLARIKQARPNSLGGNQTLKSPRVILN